MSNNHVTGPNDTTTFTYDYRHRLIEAKRTYVGGNVYDDNFTYDVWDRQIGKSEKINLATATRWTAFDGVNPYADYNGLSWATRYLYGAEVDQLFARYDATNGVEWYLTDRLGSVVDIVSATGASLDTISYDSFGNATDSNSAYANGDRFKYTGREWDAAIGQYDYGARYYDPSVGRLIARIPSDSRRVIRTFTATSLTVPPTSQIPLILSPLLPTICPRPNLDRTPVLMFIAGPIITKYLESLSLRVRIRSFSASVFTSPEPTLVLRLETRMGTLTELFGLTLGPRVKQIRRPLRMNSIRSRAIETSPPISRWWPAPQNLVQSL